MHSMPPRWEKAPVLFEASVRTISAWRCFACNPKKEQAIIFPKTATMQTTLAVRKTLAWTRPGTCGIWDTKTTCSQSGFRPRMKAAAFPDGMTNCPEILTERLPVRNEKRTALCAVLFSFRIGPVAKIQHPPGLLYVQQEPGIALNVPERQIAHHCMCNLLIHLCMRRKMQRFPGHDSSG